MCHRACHETAKHACRRTMARGDSSSQGFSRRTLRGKCPCRPRNLLGDGSGAEWAAPLPWMTPLWDPNNAACAAAIVLHESRTRSMIVLDTGGAHLGVARCCATYTRVVQRFVTGSLRTRDPERTGLQSRPSHVTEAEPDSVCDPSDAPEGTFLSPRLRLNIARVLPTDADLPLTYASAC